MNDKYRTIPAAAGVLSGGELFVSPNGDGSKTAKFRMVARSSKPIDHWYWGHVVHDISGASFKARIPIDYAHNDAEIIGYGNNIEGTREGLIVSGAFTPFTEQDRASEVVHKLAAGVPYEASINFGGDGMKIQEVAEGEVTEVNGFQFEGPGVVIREWPLRGVAVCPYGADANTETAALSGSARTFAAEAWEASAVEHDEANTERESTMSAEEQAAATIEESVEEVTETEETEAVDESSAVEESDREEESTELTEQAVDTEGNTDAVEAETPEEDEGEPLSREEFTRIVDDFGAEIAAQTVKEGGTYADALKASHDALKADNEELRERLTAAEQTSTGQPAKVVPAAEKKSVFKTTK